jgi:hypothetical protein
MNRQIRLEIKIQFSLVLRGFCDFYSLLVPFAFLASP